MARPTSFKKKILINWVGEGGIFLGGGELTEIIG